QNGGPSTGKNPADDVEYRVIFVVLTRPLVDQYLERLTGRFNFGISWPGLLRLDGVNYRWQGTGRHCVEVLFRESSHLLWIDVAHNAHGDVGWNVVGFEKLFGVPNAKAHDVACPAARHATVRVRLKCRGQQSLHQLSLGVGLYAHAPFFEYDVTLLVEFAENGMHEAL